jgi:hypothetical protein
MIDKKGAVQAAIPRQLSSTNASVGSDLIYYFGRQCARVSHTPPYLSESRSPCTPHNTSYSFQEQLQINDKKMDKHEIALGQSVENLRRISVQASIERVTAVL